MSSRSRSKLDLFTKHLDLFTKHLTCLPNTWIYETQAAHSPQGLRLSYFVEHCIYLHRIHASVSSFVRRQVILSIIVRPQRLLYTTRSRELERQRKQLLVWGRVWYVRKVRGGGLRLLWSITLLSFDLHNATQHTYNDNNDNTPASISSPRGGNGDRPSLGRFPQFFIYVFQAFLEDFNLQTLPSRRLSWSPRQDRLCHYTVSLLGSRKF